MSWAGEMGVEGERVGGGGGWGVEGGFRVQQVGGGGARFGI